MGGGPENYWIFYGSKKGTECMQSEQEQVIEDPGYEFADPCPPSMRQVSKMFKTSS